MDYEDGNSAEKVAAIPLPTSSSSRRILLLEDLPNVSHAPTRASFNNALAAFLHQSEEQDIPLIIILSESVPRLDDQIAEGSPGRGFRERNEATLTFRTLIPERIRSSVAFTHIE